jgi:hypothetical protein
MLGSLAESRETQRRIGYAAPHALQRAIDDPIDRKQLLTVVLGHPEAASAAQRPDAFAVARIGAATVIDDTDGRRTVAAPGSASAAALASTTPPRSVLAAETMSALQACLGDPAAEVLVGPGTLGPAAGIGAALLTSDAPGGGAIVRICAAPHYVRQLAPIRRQFSSRFAELRPRAVVEPVEIGERDVVRVSVPAGALRADQIAALLSGGPALVRFAREPARGRSGRAFSESQQLRH